ncbi:uncharacterized protein LOC101861514 [Aplysia californica]|uniref:Uncharacterized protein LOC101861514 n=1 Tax=Aplysia californica TaxID=6500 RepID=A0ABM0JTM9_APLCA|nr:uncharacterized protein LOC101861514 [Aplysia californica]
MELAYTGLCTLDLEELRQNIRCLLSTPEIRRCYATFNQGINQIAGLQRQQQLPRVTMEQLACNVSVARYQCETAVYRFCNARAGEIMQDFFFAGVTQECRDATGVRSRYVDIFTGGAVTLTYPGTVPLMLAALLVLFLTRFS